MYAGLRKRRTFDPFFHQVPDPVLVFALMLLGLVAICLVVLHVGSSP